MNAQQLQQQFEEARNEALQLQSRNADPATLSAAVTRATNLKARLAQVQSNSSLSAQLDRMTSGMVVSGGRPGSQSLGDLILASETGKWLRDPSNVRASTWRSTASEIPIPWHGADYPMMRAATLSGDPASGGKLVIADYQPGIVPLPTRPLRVADLFAFGTTDSNAVVYMVESAFTNAAGAVAETAAKPESTLTFDQVNEPVRKIATWLPVSDEMLDDVPTLGAYLDARLRVAIELTIEDQLVSGNGTPPNISGVLDRAGLAPSIARTTESNADAILKQISAIENSTFMRPDAVVMNAANWSSILTSKDTAGAYYGGGPLATPAQPMLWGLPVVLTPSVVTGTALVGAFKVGGQVFHRGGLRVEMSNSHAAFFIENKVAILAESRLALAIYRPAAFGTVTNLS